MGDPESSEDMRTVICVDNIHGYVDKLCSLWSNFESFVGSAALVVFPGYYSDQGPHTRHVIKDRWNVKKGMPYKGFIYDAESTFESYGVPHRSASKIYWKKCGLILKDGRICFRH